MNSRFELAGYRPDNDKVFLLSHHRKYADSTTIFHRNDYHTIVRMSKDVLKKNFKYERSTGIYRNLTGITWGMLKKVADVETIDISRGYVR